MKKIASLLLSVLLLCTLSVTAWADEDPNCFTLSDITVYFTDDGERSSYNYLGLELTFASVETEDGQVFVVNTLVNNNLLLDAVLKPEDNKLYIAVDGLSHTYYLDTSLPITSEYFFEEGALSEEQINAMLSHLMENLEFSKKGNTMTFRIPYSTINNMLEQILSAVEPFLDIDSEIFEQFKSVIVEMKETNSGFDISGSFVVNENDIKGVADIAIVDNGVAEDRPFVYVDFASSINGAIDGHVVIYVQDDRSYSQVASLNFSVADPVDVELQIQDVTFHGTIGMDNPYMLLWMAFDDDLYGVGGAYQLDNRDVTICPIGDRSAALDVLNLNEEDLNTIQSEIMALFSGLSFFSLPSHNS